MASHADTRQGIGSSPSGLPGGGVPHDDEPTAFVKTPRQLIVVVILGFAIPIVLIVLLFISLFLISAGLDEIANPRVRRNRA